MREIRRSAGWVSGVSGATLVFPCYNEEKRLDDGALIALCEQRPDLRLVLVNDGSTDGTLSRLQAIATRLSPRADVLPLPENVGKAEAVRRGLLAALTGPRDLVGYFDADFSTPVPEILRLLAAMEQRGVAVAIGSRVTLLGSDIHRSPVRHYLGRVFASLASLTLGLSVYDTQCGAKVFRCGAALAAALETPFLSRWAFDVELLGRLLIGTPSSTPVPAADFLEVPLGRWNDVPGSKLRPAAMVGMLRELAIIWADLQRRRRAVQGG
jgi:dolichyl-phosphate beta-glucosyltransferase